MVLALRNPHRWAADALGGSPFHSDGNGRIKQRDHLGYSVWAKRCRSQRHYPAQLGSELRLLWAIACNIR